MTGESSNPCGGNTKPYDITNIKAFVPPIFDLNQLNYDSWGELLQTHCIVLVCMAISMEPQNQREIKMKNGPPLNLLSRCGSMEL